MNYKYVAIYVGDLIKWDVSLNEIERAARAIFNFDCETFTEKETMTSQRAALFYDWVMTLAIQKMDNERRNALLIQFCNSVVPDEHADSLKKILDSAQTKSKPRQESLSEFIGRGFHAQIHKHSSKLFKDKYYSLAVFEAAKAYNNLVKEKSKSSLDGQALMQNVWGWEKGVLKITRCESDTDKNIQDGMKFLSAGLIGAFRNPAAHETAIEWPISKEDCLNILSFMSFLFKKLGEAEYYKGGAE